jgi:O-glycosyl hydrolase
MKKYVAFLGFSLALCGAAQAGGPDAPEAGLAFRLDPSLIRETWGGGKQARQFFDEQLPACFERTLKVSRWGDAGGRLDWIFTGPRAGVTLKICCNEVRLVTRQYDSLALPSEKTKGVDQSVATGQVNSVTLRLDHRLMLTVLVNERPVAQQLWMHDLVHHQAVQQGGGAIEAQLVRPAVADVVVRVQADRRHQAILGFGGITLAPAYRLLSAEGQRQWWQLLREYNLLLHREYPMGAQLNAAMDNWDRLADAVPHYYGDNFPNSEVSDFDYLKQLRAIGGLVMFEFWKLPPWAEQDVAKYAAAVVRYCQLSQEKTGRPPEIVGIQNEVRQPAEKFQAMTLALRQALDAAGFRAVQIHMADSAVLAAGLGYLKDFQARPEVWQAIDYAATHMYDYQKAFTDPDRFDQLLTDYRAQAGSKSVLSTELCVNDGRFQTDSYRVALQLGQLYHKNLVLLDATALAYCWLLLNVEQPSYGMTRSLFVPDLQQGGVPVASSAQLRVFGAFSRKNKAGMVRVETSCPDPDLLTTAFSGKDDRATVVVLNRSLRPVRVALEWPGVTFTATELCSPYAPNSAGPADQRLVPPGGILTLTNVEK